MVLSEIIKLQHVHKSFGAHIVLNNVSFQVNAGEIVGLIGPSGAGKSTIIKIILGMEQADQGVATVFNTQMPNRKLLNNIGYMAQSDALYTSLTARENLAFFVQMNNLTQNQTAEIDRVASVVDLTSDLNTRVQDFSGGMKRRLSLAIALLGQPDLLVLDEPTVGIDPALRQKIWQELARLRDNGQAILVTTHVMDEAELTDRVALLLGGDLIANDTPHALEAAYQVTSIEHVLLIMKIIAIAKRVLLELVRDKRTLALLFIAPLLVLLLMNYVFSVNTTTTVRIATVNVTQPIVQNMAATKHVTVKTYNSRHAADQALANRDVDTTISVTNNTYHVTHANTDVAKTNLAKMALQSALTNNQLHALTTTVTGRQTSLTPQQPVKITNTYNYGNAKSTFFAKMMPILMGFFVFFFVFLISGMALLRERTSGTLERLLATPVRRSDIVFGYMLSYGAIAVIQTLLIVGFTVKVLKVQVAGSIWLVVLTTVLLALVALALGIFMSTFAQSEFQMMQFIPIIVVPQIFFSGLMSLQAMATWAQWLANLLPMKYAANALTSIILTGAKFSDIAGNLIALLFFIIILTTGNIVGLKRYRKA